MNKVRLTEEKLRDLIHESINELITEGILGNVWDEVKTNISAGFRNDVRNIMGNVQDNYDERVFQYYGKPLISEELQMTQQDLNRIEALYRLRKENNGKLDEKSERELSNLEFKLNRSDIFTRQTDNYGNTYIVGEDDYVNNSALKQNLSFRTDGKIFKNVVGKYVNSRGNFINGKNYKMLSTALISYRKDRDAAWIKLYKTYGAQLFISGNKPNQINVG